MKRRLFIGAGIGLSVTNLVSCGGNRKDFVNYISVSKNERKMRLYSNEKLYKTYNIDLGFAPVGHKRFEGDGKTPEGRYVIWKKNGRSQFHRSIGISYPNTKDRNFASLYNKSAGGDIFIHGGPSNSTQQSRKNSVGDWTAGCIAVSDREAEQIYEVVKVGAVIDILP